MQPPVRRGSHGYKPLCRLFVRCPQSELIVKRLLTSCRSKCDHDFWLLVPSDLRHYHRHNLWLDRFSQGHVQMRFQQAFSVLTFLILLASCDTRSLQQGKQNSFLNAFCQIARETITRSIITISLMLPWSTRMQSITDRKKRKEKKNWISTAVNAMTISSLQSEVVQSQLVRCHELVCGD